MERKRPASSKSSEKQHLSETYSEEIVLRTRSKTGQRYQRINYCEDSSSDESVKRFKEDVQDNSPGKSVNVETVETTAALAVERKLKKVESPPYLPDSSDHSESGSSDFLDPDAIADDKGLKMPPSPPYFPMSSGLSESGNSPERLDADTISDNDRLEEKAPDSPYFPSTSDLSENESSALLYAGANVDDKKLNKAPDSPTNFKSSPDHSESGSSLPFRHWGQNVLKPNESLRHSKDEELHKKDGTEDLYEGSARNSPKVTKTDTSNYEWEKWKARAIAEKMKELKRSERNEAEKVAEKVSPMIDMNKSSTKPFGHSELQEDQENHGTDEVDNASGRNKPEGLNVEMSRKDSVKDSADISQVENRRSKIDDMEEDGDKHRHDGSIENIAETKFSPVTAVRKENTKRRSDPSNALKENRPRTSL